MVAEDDAARIEAAQHDPALFGVLYEETFDTVYAYIARRVRDRHDVEDLTSTVYQRALAALPGFEWRGVPFVAWLLRIAANEVARQQNRPRAAETVDDTAADASELEEAEQLASLYGLVRALPSDQRRTLTLRFVQDLSVQQVAETLGRSEGAVKQLQHRAIETLRRQHGGADA